MSNIDNITIAETEKASYVAPLPEAAEAVERERPVGRAVEAELVMPELPTGAEALELITRPLRETHTHTYLAPKRAETSGLELLYSGQELHFTGIAKSVVAKGWSVFPQERDSGRMPGKAYGEVIKWKTEHDLQNRLPTPEALELWNSQCGNLNVALVFGPASANTFAIDIDVMNAEKSEDIQNMAEEFLGYTQFRRVGMAPKMALIYRHGPAAEEEVPSTSKKFTVTDESGNVVPAEDGLEILGAGKLITIYGLHHKTGNYFTWEDADPLLFGPEAAPLVTKQQVEAFMEAVDAKYGFVKRASGGGQQTFETTVIDGITVSVPRGGAEVVRGSDGRVIDGRRPFLNSLIFATARENAEAILAIGDDEGALKHLLAGLATAIAQTFKAEAVTADRARWQDPQLSKEIWGNLRQTADKVMSGTIRPILKPRLQRATPAAALAPDAADELLPKNAEKRMSIRLEAGETTVVVNQIERALREAKVGIYGRGRYVARVIEVREHDSQGARVRREIDHLDEHALAEAISRAALFTRFDMKKDKEVVVDMPLPLAKTLMSRRGQWSLPSLSGIITAPTLRADGSVLSEPGYDMQTGLILCPDVQMSGLIENPCQEQAQAAMQVIKDVIRTFPFVSEVDRAVALSAILTAAVRRSMRTAPMHAFTAPTAGSGKSKLADIASAVAVGSKASVVQYARGEEFEKRLGTELLKGSSVIAIDNVSSALGGDLICQMLTQETVTIRVLGKSEAPTLPTNALVTATGNNLPIDGDMTRRTVMSRLDAGCERPETRSFDFDPVELALQRRGELIGAALTLLRAYITAGRPWTSGSHLGSFEDWSRLVRGALIWLGEADPCASMDSIRESDPQLEALTGVMDHWKAACGQKRVTARDLVDLAVAQVPGTSGYNTVFERPDFREALLAVAGAGGAINTVRFGKWLNASKGRIVNGFRIEQMPKLNGNVTWCLSPVAKE